MAKKNLKNTPVVETPVVTVDVQNPVEAVVTETPVEAKAKKARYAPTSVLVDNAVIVKVKPQAKGPSEKSKAAARYNRFYSEGQTVAEYIAANKAANVGGTLARNDLRWDLEHGHIELSQPAQPETPAQQEG